MNIVHEFLRLGRAHGTSTPTKTLKRWLNLDLRHNTLTAGTKPVVVPAMLNKRGSAAKQRPNCGYDSARYAFSSDGPFLRHFREVALAAKDDTARRLIESYQANPVHSLPGLHAAKDIGPEIIVNGTPLKLSDWVVLTDNGEPIAMRPRMFAQFCALTEESAQEGELGYDVFAAEYGTIARLHPAIPFGEDGGSSTNLLTVNEGANQFHGERQGYNFPMTVANAAAYTRGAAHLLQHAAFMTRDCVVLMWPVTGTEHPIMPIVKAIASKYYKLRDADTVNTLWARLEALPELDTPIQLAALVRKMTRISVRGYRVLPAATIRANLLEFRRVFSVAAGLPTTFRWILPHTTQRGTPSISDVCLLDTAWAVLTGERYSPHLLTTIKARLTQLALDKDWSVSDPFSLLCHRWSEILQFGSDENMDELNQEMSEQERGWREGLHESIRRKFEQRILLSNSSLRVRNMDHPAYRWGRFLAVCCAVKVYYHWMYSDRKVLPKPQEEALRRGTAQPRAFLASYRPERYLEQVAKRAKTSPMVHVYRCLMDQLNDHPPAQFTDTEKSLVRAGFVNQMAGLDKARFHKHEPDDAVEDNALSA